MKRPWHVWLAFGLCLAVVVSAMAWLTLKTLELDRAESVARQQVELENDISRALWRMDAKLTPILAQEAARPEMFYDSFLPTPPKGKNDRPAEPTPSPLLVQPSDFVLVNFQLGRANQLSSPQCPSDGDVQLAISCGVVPDRLHASAERLAKLAPALRYDDLLHRLPQQTLSATAGTSAWLAANSRRGAPPESPVVNSFVESAQLQQEVRGGPSATPQTAAENNAVAIAPENGNFNGQGGRGQSRGGNDIQNRQSAFQAYAQQSLVAQNTSHPAPPRITVREGVSQPLWVDSYLLLARRVTIGDVTTIQGCWLDWPQLRQMLIEEVADLLPDVTLDPVTDTNQVRLSRLLATLPVQLSVPAPVATPGLVSPLRISLIVAWLCLLLTAVAVAGLLWGVVRLSERRAAFVSAVTHELRTPLTTFRMYSEMLAAGMVPDEQQRQSYLNTLRTEADRLAHLVENVLQYARLERGGGPGRGRELLTIGSVLDRTAARLRDRASAASMQFDILADDAARQVTFRSDATAIEQILFNLVDNACKYAARAADRRIELCVTTQRGSVRFSVKDQGPGISEKAARRLFRPFSKSVEQAANSAPGVGLGLALCRRLATDLGGRLELEPANGDGASFVLTLPVAQPA